MKNFFLLPQLLRVLGALLWLAAACSFGACSKNSAEPPNVDASLFSLAADPGVTEAWLTVTYDSAFTGPQGNIDWEIVIERGDSSIARFVSGRDTTVLDAGLQPGQDYSYHAYLVGNPTGTGNTPPGERTAPLRTLEPTSHDFSWTLDTLGTGSSLLLDVAIIDENDIWAVGEIHTPETGQFDSLGNWIQPYNAAHWNGSEWELKRILYLYHGQSIFHPLNFVFPFENGQIWFGGNGIIKWNGQRFSNVEVPQSAWGPVAINKTWGSSNTNVYIVGNKGHIAHYNGSTWQRIESGTDLPIQDIWGAVDRHTGKMTIFCPASKKYQTSAKKVLQIDPKNNRVSEISWPYQDRRVHSVWFKYPINPWICGGCVFSHDPPGWKAHTTLPSIFFNRIRGNDLNDIFIVGDVGFVAHFNGMDWQTYPEVNFPSIYHSLAYKGSIMAAVGQKGGRGYILRMYKNQ